MQNYLKLTEGNWKSKKSIFDLNVKIAFLILSLKFPNNFLRCSEIFATSLSSLWPINRMTNKSLKSISRSSDAQIFARFLVSVIDFEPKIGERGQHLWQLPISNLSDMTFEINFSPRLERAKSSYCAYLNFFQGFVYPGKFFHANFVFDFILKN